MDDHDERFWRHLWDYCHFRTMGRRDWALECLREGRRFYRDAYRAGFRWRDHPELLRPGPDKPAGGLKQYYDAEKYRRTALADRRHAATLAKKR